jgi:hypothetical protein
MFPRFPSGTAAELTLARAANVMLAVEEVLIVARHKLRHFAALVLAPKKRGP